MMQKTLQLFDGKKVVFVEQGDGEPILFIHGVGLRAQAWSPQTDELSKKYRTIAVNMPGHDGSDGLPEGSDLSDFIDWAAQVIRQVSAKPICVVGHSMGAMIAVGLAIKHPELVQRIAVLNIVYQRDDTARQAVTARANDIQQGMGDILAPLERWFGTDETQCRASSLVKQWLTSVDREGYATAYVAFATGDLFYASGLKDIACPTMIITGDGDMNSTPQMAQTMANAIDMGEVIVIKEHKHMVNMTAPDKVNQVLLDWLEAKTV